MHRVRNFVRAGTEGVPRPDRLAAAVVVENFAMGGSATQIIVAPSTVFDLRQLRASWA
jgi:hypothetical protein